MDGETAASVLAAAGLFGLPHVQHVCSCFLLDHVDDSNAARIVSIAEQCNVPALLGQTRAHMLRHFTRVPLDDDFCSLSLDTVLSLLGSDDLCARHEEPVYLAAVAWLAHADHMQHARAVLQCIRWHELPRSFIESVVTSSPVVASDASSLDQARAAMSRSFTAPHNSRGPAHVVVMGGIVAPASTAAVMRAQAGEWVDAPSCRLHRRHAACVMLDNGTVFVIGGLVERSHTLEPTASVEIYRPSTGQWHAGTDYPLPITAARASHVNNTVFVTGGASTLQHSLALAYTYDDASSKWTALPPMHEARRFHAMAACTGHVYVIGGRSGSASLDAVEKFDPQTNTWARVGSCLTPRSYCAAVSVGSTVYLVGGENNSWQPLADCEAYDASTDTWRPLPPMHVERSFVTAVASDGLAMHWHSHHFMPAQLDPGVWRQQHAGRAGHGRDVRARVRPVVCRHAPITSPCCADVACRAWLPRMPCSRSGAVAFIARNFMSST